MHDWMFGFHQGIAKLVTVLRNTQKVTARPASPDGRSYAARSSSLSSTPALATASFAQAITSKWKEWEEESIFALQEEESLLMDENCHGCTLLQGTRDSMEDVLCCIPDLFDFIGITEKKKSVIGLYAVFDGHSGREAASFMKERLPYVLGHHKLVEEDLQEAIRDSFLRLDAEFLKTARSQNIYAGTTAAVVLHCGNMLITANVGDGRAVLSKNGMAFDIIVPQSPGRDDERKRITSRNGWVTEEQELHMSKLHFMDLEDPLIRQRAEKVVRWTTVYRINGELAVSRSIGDMDYKGVGLTEYLWAYPDRIPRTFIDDLIIANPECQSIQISGITPFMVMASDGVWDVMDCQKAIETVAEALASGQSVQVIYYLIII